MDIYFIGFENIHFFDFFNFIYDNSPLLTWSTQALLQRGDLGIYLPLNFLKVKIIKCKENPISVELSQETRTETRISNFNLKEDLVRFFFKNCKEKY